MSGLLAWFLIALASLVIYVCLALAGQPFWVGLPFLALVLVAQFRILTFERRARGSYD